MSIDINWETLTGGPDGEALAETIREFIHERFQSIALPKLVRSVAVHSFEFGQISPEIILKDIGDPLPDFYETDDDASSLDAEHEQDASTLETRPGTTRHVRAADGSRRQPELNLLDRTGTSSLARGTTPGVLGATTNLGYFHLPLSAGLPGTPTPLAAVAGGGFASGQGPSHPQPRHQHTDSFSSTSPPSLATPTSSQGHAYVDQPPAPAVSDEPETVPIARRHDHPERSPDDVQVVFHVTYAGDIKLSLTADVFLDYPMPSFVGIPLKLKITGLTFNGVGILAYIKKRAHLCFLSPDDAEALVGGEQSLVAINDKNGDADRGSQAHRVGALLEDIKIESEMGETESGKQVLKNVGKIERFILEQVQRIFEDEFVYPSFWTFLV